MKDKNGKEIKIGQDVDFPEPNDTDIHNFAFRGYVEGFRGEFVQVLDGDNELFEIEPERLEIVY
jgi:hypothetical protein